MGGGRRFEYPKHVWSPSGGWWAEPVHWKRNTVIGGLVIAAIIAVVYPISERKTVSYYPKIVEREPGFYEKLAEEEAARKAARRSARGLPAEGHHSNGGHH